MYKKCARKSLDKIKSKKDKWDEAITDANELVQDFRKKVATLKRSIKAFERLRDSGVPFPGENKNESAQ